MSTDLHSLSGAFALDALSADEAQRFRMHLQGCAVCQQEVRELREAATRMAEVEAVPPPAALKARVLAAADRTPQKPPKVADTVAPSSRRRWVPRLAAAAAAVVLAVAAGVGVAQLAGDDEPPLAADVVQVLEADDVRTAEVETSHGPVLVATSQGRGEMALDTSGLHRLAAPHVYQLWSITGGAPTSAGVLDDPGTGASMDLPATGSQVAITVEPAGGSDQPTTEPIVVVDPATV